MSYPMIDHAVRVSDWASMVELPKELADALDLFDEARHIQGPYVAVDVDKLTAKNLEAEAAKVAAGMAAREYADKASAAVRNALAGKVLRLAAAAVPELTEQLRDEFGTAAAEFVAAVEMLPDTLSAAALVDAGAVALGAYERAKAAQAVIDRACGWLVTLDRVPGASTEPFNSYLAVLAPRTRADYRTITKAKANELGLHPALVAAVRESIEFRLSSPAEQKALRTELEAQPAEKPNVKVFGGGTGSVGVFGSV